MPDTSSVNITAGSLQQEIHVALREPDPILANLKITRCHYLLAQALERVLGVGAGANFHSWAVWGSRKAGVTIRQEDLDQARRDSSVVGGTVGALVGLGCGWWLGLTPMWLPAAALLGAGCGLAVGRLIIQRSRQRSASLILAGNRTVLDDIGTQTARFVDWLGQASGTVPLVLTDFLAGLPAGATNQELLRQAFTHYFEAHLSRDVADKQQATYLANCFAVWHEHVRLEPYIRGAMPLIIRRCVTQRLLQFDIGPLRLAVSQDVPRPVALVNTATPPSAALDLLRSMSGDVMEGTNAFTGTAARDWTRIKERMRYVFALFHAFHTEPQVCLAPYDPTQLAAIAAGRYPANW
jgi:hypothetical protein